MQITAKTPVKLLFLVSCALPSLLVAALQESSEIAGLRMHAAMGDTNAQIELGYCYSKQPDDHSKMMRWWSEAARGGNPRAKRLCAEADVANYNKQTGDADWLNWIQQAADSNDPIAQRMLGNSYAAGTHTPVDLPRALKWWRKSALGGDFEATGHIANAYSEGKGTSKSSREALTWL